jgi:hypothetical protein
MLISVNQTAAIWRGYCNTFAAYKDDNNQLCKKKSDVLPDKREDDTYVAATAENPFESIPKGDRLLHKSGAIPKIKTSEIEGTNNAAHCKFKKPYKTRRYSPIRESYTVRRNPRSFHRYDDESFGSPSPPRTRLNKSNHLRNYYDSSDYYDDYYRY